MGHISGEALILRHRRVAEDLGTELRPFALNLDRDQNVEARIYSSVAEDENHVRLVTALKSGRLSGECGLGMRIGCERPVANSKLLLERNMLEGRSPTQEHIVATKVKQRVMRPYTKTEEKELRAHSKAKTPVSKIAKLTKRTEGALRQKAKMLGIGLGHQR